METTMDQLSAQHWATLDYAGRYQLLAKSDCGLQFAARHARDEFPELPLFARLRLQERIAEHA